MNLSNSYRTDSLYMLRCSTGIYEKEVALHTGGWIDTCYNINYKI